MLSLAKYQHKLWFYGSTLFGKLARPQFLLQLKGNSGGMMCHGVLLPLRAKGSLEVSLLTFRNFGKYFFA